MNTWLGLVLASNHSDISGDNDMSPDERAEQQEDDKRTNRGFVIILWCIAILFGGAATMALALRYYG